MLIARDLADRYTVHVKTIYVWHRSGVLPAAIEVGGSLRWREEDIALWDEWLSARAKARTEGLDPDSPNGPAPPVYSTGCKTADPRQLLASRREAKRQERRTKAAENSPVTYEEA